MVKTIVTAYVDAEIKEKMKELAYRKQTKMSTLIAHVLRNYIKEVKIAETEMLLCEKCGTKYSEKLKVCPNCEANKELKAREKAVKKKEYKEALQAEFNRLMERRTQLIEYHQQGKATAEEVQNIEQDIKEVKEKMNGSTIDE